VVSDYYSIFLKQICIYLKENVFGGNIFVRKDREIGMLQKSQVKNDAI
jgi:hypothetical protein